MGIEVEANVVRDGGYAGGDYLAGHSDEEDRYYIKEDCSFEGYEVVTHPGTLQAYRDGDIFAWDVWHRWIRDYDVRLENGEGNGLHVHIDRNAFYANGTRRHGGTLNVAHLWMFTQLIYHNPADWQRIGGRANSSYADWSNVARLRHRALTYAKGDNYPERNTPVNFQKHATIELRFLKPHRSTWRMLGKLEAIAGAVRYTRELRPSDVARGALEFGAFAAWMRKNPAEYGNALRLIGG